MGWYEDGGFAVNIDPAKGTYRFRVTFHGTQPAGKDELAKTVSKTDLLGMRREISRALKQDKKPIMKTTEDLTDSQLMARDIFCMLTGVALMLLGALALVWLIWGIIDLHVIGTVEGLTVLPCWLLGITLLDIATSHTQSQ